jgi:hypothetical protein
MERIKRLLDELEFRLLGFFLCPAARALILRELRRQYALQMQVERRGRGD